MDKKGQFVLVVSGVGGAGKDSVLEKLRAYPERFNFWLSYTDKPPRKDEIPGKTYNYISKEDFDELLKKNKFLEWEQVRGEYRYGRLHSDSEEIFKSGKIPVLSIDVKGAEKLKKLGLDIVSVFIIPPSLEEAERRLKSRGDTKEQIKDRLERYPMEMSHKNKYDHVIVNSELETAQKELMGIVKEEKLKRDQKSRVKKTFQNFVLILAAALFLGAAGTKAYFLGIKNILKTASQNTTAVSDTLANIENQSTDTQGDSSALAIKSTPPSKEITKKITETPPEYTAPKTNAIKTDTNSDGSKTVVVSTGGTANSDSLGDIAGITVNSPADIVYEDQTGTNAALGPVLKTYLNDTLKWKSEISAMKKITLEDAGATGWAGQYLGQYNVSSDGQKILSVTGSIILNTHYYKDSPYFVDYMKLTLSHEYGHHYTLYHKWIDWNLQAGVRFPDSYYSTRPLSKETTAADYSLGWNNCESEIIAEDYSYLYSGYSYHGMAGTYGYPSASMKNWLDRIGDPSLLQLQTNNPPIITITSPADGATLGGAISFQADASDDNGIASVSFFIGSTQISSDNSAPYEANLNTATYPNGSYTLKAVASDGSLTSEKVIVVTIENISVDIENPQLFFLLPDTNPYSWLSGDLIIKVRATDNIEVSKIEFYINDTLVLTSDQSQFNASWHFSDATTGVYTLRARAYDTAGNTAEATTVVDKS